jgi:hypothetical protein
MLNKIDRCQCGAVQGYWFEPGMEIPFCGKQMLGAHSPIGCFRIGGGPAQIAGLYEQLTGHSSDKLSYWVAFQVVISKLRDNLDMATWLHVVLTPSPLHTPMAYETPSPAHLKRVVGIPGGTQRSLMPANPPAKWEQTSGRVKPPWEK